MESISGNQRSDLLTPLMKLSLVLRLPRKMHLCRSSSNVPRLPSFSEMLQSPHVLLTFNDEVHNPLPLPRETISKRPKMFRTYQLLHFWLCNVLRATPACTFSTSQFPKVVRTWCSLHILTWTCALRHNGVHLFIISTSKSSPNLVCFVHFDFDMCFVPRRRALFHHLNFQKRSEPVFLCAFWLRHVLRTTTACTFSSSQHPKVVRASPMYSSLWSGHPLRL